MSQLLLCPHGHEWEPTEEQRSSGGVGQLICPVCGTAVITNDVTVMGSRRGIDQASLSDRVRPSQGEASLGETFCDRAGQSDVVLSKSASVDEDCSQKTQELAGHSSSEVSDDNSGTVRA